jgi:hypothetical protein
VIPYIPFQRLTRCQDGSSRCQLVGVGVGWYWLVRVGGGRYRALVRVGARRCGGSWCQAVPAGESRYQLMGSSEIGNVGYNPCSSMRDCNNYCPTYHD